MWNELWPIIEKVGLPIGLLMVAVQYFTKLFESSNRKLEESQEAHRRITEEQNKRYEQKLFQMFEKMVKMQEECKVEIMGIAESAIKASAENTEAIRQLETIIKSSLKHER